MFDRNQKRCLQQTIMSIFLSAFGLIAVVNLYPIWGNSFIAPAILFQKESLYPPDKNKIKNPYLKFLGRYRRFQGGKLYGH